MNTKTRSATRDLVLAALFLALAFVLPMITGHVPQIGNMLCPMHFPVLLAGFVLGGPWGLALGFLAPLLRSVLFGMPPLGRQKRGLPRHSSPKADPFMVSVQQSAMKK